MPFTLATFRDSIRTILSDKTIWRDSMLNSWISDGIRDYSFFFPLEKSLAIDCVAGQHEYSLASITPLIGVLSVEYPDGQDPPRYLLHVSESHPSFYQQPFYDLRDGSPPYLVIGEDPTDSNDDVILRYHTLHTIPTIDSSTLTFPDDHGEIIRLYVYWKALVQLEISHDVDAARKTAMLNALGGSAKDAEYAYHYKMRQFQGPAPHTAYTGPWKMDDKDRIY